MDMLKDGYKAESVRLRTSIAALAKGSADRQVKEAASELLTAMDRWDSEAAARGGMQ